MRQKLDGMSWADVSKWACWIITVGGVVLTIVFGLYTLRFWSQPFSGDPADWGVFGDFVGGTANPFLSFLTVVMLAWTIILQARQLSISSNELRLSRKELKLSREELKLTRSELQRSASAQELSEEALRSQAAAAGTTAQLAAINALMDYYAGAITRESEMSYPEGDPHLIELQNLKDRHMGLQKRLEQMYDQLTGVDDVQQVHDR